MPAGRSSLIPSVLALRCQADPLRPAEPPHLLAYLATVTDPRARAGRRHPLPPSSGSPLPRSWRGRGRLPRSPSGPRTHPSRSVPRSGPAATRSPADGSSRPRPRSAARLRGSTPRPWPPRWARGSPTVTTQASGGGRWRSTARRYAAPAATAARSTYSPRWTTPPAPCSPNARSTAPPAKSQAWSRCRPPGTRPRRRGCAARRR